MTSHGCGENRLIAYLNDEKSEKLHGLLTGRNGFSHLTLGGAVCQGG